MSNTSNASSERGQPSASVPRLPARFFIPRHRSPIAKQMGEQENNTTQGQSKVSRGTLASSMIRDWIRGELDPPPIAILPRYQERHGHTWSTEAVAGHVTLPHAFGDESMATFSSGPKPELDDADVGARLDDGDLGSLESNGESSIISSKIFSRVTSEQPTTAPTSFLPNKRTAAPVVNDTNNVDAMSAENAAGSANILTAEYDLNLDSQARVEVNSSADWPDVATDYSRASTMSHSDPYIQAFYEVLFRDMHRLFDDQNLHSIDAEQLDAILKTFALKLHGESANPFERDASVTLHRQRRDIVYKFSGEERGGEDTASEDDEPIRKPFRKPESMTMSWLQGVVDGLGPPALDDANSVSDDESQPFQLSEYETFICQSGAYKWLLYKINQLQQIQRGEPDAMLSIGANIRAQLRDVQSHRKLSRSVPSLTTTVTFELEWSPLRFCREQGISSRQPRILSKVMGITGSCSECQATSLQDYLEWTWPISSAPLIALMHQLLPSPEGTSCDYQTQGPGAETTHLVALVTGHDSTVVTVTSGLPFISEIAEQLAWLGAAMRSPPVSGDEKAVMYSATIGEFQTSNHHSRSSFPQGSSLTCKIKFALIEIPDALDRTQTDGTCWLPFFWTPFTVLGYPIPARPAANLGLEIALDTMASLLGTNQIVRLNERTFIKGFNFLAVAIRETAGVVAWHLLQSHDPTQRVSYNDARLNELNIQLPAKMSLHDLSNKRHIIGWCSEAREVCGRSEAELNVKPSGLRKPPAFIRVDRLYIGGRSQMMGGLNMSVNNKQKPIRLDRRNDYPSLLKWMSLQVIVFYDVDTRRAWLVDGASALLYLLRISLHRDQNDPESTYDWILDTTKLIDMWEDLPARQSALNFLKNADNCRARLYPVIGMDGNGDGAEQFVTLGVRITGLIRILEVLIDAQGYSDPQGGLKIPQTTELRRNLTGFDIGDILQPMGDTHSRMRTLGSHGHGWSNLVSELGITTIFGRGFGDLIRPSDQSGVCVEWRLVPLDKDYMTVSVSTLKMLLDQLGDKGILERGAGEISKGLVWLSHQESLNDCQCLGKHIENTSVATHINPLQVLGSKRAWNMSKLSARRDMWAPMQISSLDIRGAVVFGYFSSILSGWMPEKDESLPPAQSGDENQELQDTPVAPSAPSSSATRSSGFPSHSLTTSGLATGSTELSAPSSRSAAPTGELGDDATSGTQEMTQAASAERKKESDNKGSWVARFKGKLKRRG